MKELVDARDKLGMAYHLRARFLANHPQSRGLDQQAKELNEHLVALQRATAKPYAYRFEVRPIVRTNSPARIRPEQ